MNLKVWDEGGSMLLETPCMLYALKKGHCTTRTWYKMFRIKKTKQNKTKQNLPRGPTAAPFVESDMGKITIKMNLA